jgi:hypothetical protein
MPLPSRGAFHRWQTGEWLVMFRSRTRRRDRDRALRRYGDLPLRGTSAIPYRPAPHYRASASVPAIRAHRLPKRLQGRLPQREY